MAGYDTPRSRPRPEDRMELSREDAEAVLAARQELGREYEPAVVDSFLERVDHSIDARIEQRFEAHAARRRKEPMGSGTLALISFGFAVPLSAIAGGIAQLPGLIVVWCAIVLINVAHAARRPR